MTEQDQQSYILALEQKIEELKKTDDYFSLVVAYFELAKQNKRLEKHSESRKYLNIAIDLLEKYETDIDPSIHYNIYVLAGDLFLKRHAHITAEKYYKRAIEYSTDDKEKVKILLKIIHVNIRRGDFKEALQYAQQGKKLTEHDEDPRALATILKYIIRIYSREGNSDKALETFKILDQTIDLERKSFELARLYHMSKSYENALKFYKEAEENETNLERIIELNVFKARVSLNLNKDEEAFRYLNEVDKKKDIIKDTIEYLYLHESYTIYYLKTNQLNKAREYHRLSMDLFGKYANFNRINNFYNDLKEINEKITFEFAIDHPFGLLWLKESEIDKVFSTIDINIWRLIAKGTENLWKYYLTYIGTDTNEGDILEHWKFRQITDNISANITSERILNFIIGPNDLDTAELRSEEEGLLPLWFIEIPPFMHHEHEYLKLRLNNMVHKSDEFMGYPIFDNPGFHGRPIERMKVTIKTGWFDEFVIDHVFIPNTQSEYETSRRMGNHVWLKDIYRLDLQDNCQKEDKIDLDIYCELFFDNKSHEPDIKITQKEFSIQVYRKNRLQKLEKIKKRNENALAILIAITSLVGTGYGILTSFFYPILLENHLSFWENLSLYIGVGFVVLLIFGVLGLFLLLILKLEINKEVRNSKIQSD